MRFISTITFAIAALVLVAASANAQTAGKVGNGMSQYNAEAPFSREALEKHTW